VADGQQAPGLERADVPAPPGEAEVPPRVANARLVSDLEEAIRSVRGDDALRRVAVIVPNHLLGAWLFRSIFRETGHMAIDFVLAHELAWRVAASSLLAEGRARVLENVDVAILLAAIPEATRDAATPDYLRAAAGMAGFGPAALRTIEDLSGAGLTPEALDVAAPASADPEKMRLLARLWRAFAAGLDKAGLLDRASLYAAAARALPSAETGGVIVCGLDDPPPAAVGFLEALRRHYPFALVGGSPSGEAAPRHAARQSVVVERLGGWSPTPATGEPTNALQRLQRQPFGPPNASVAATELDPSLEVLSAAGESLEAVEIARMIQRDTSEGVRFEEIAVLLRSRDTYAAPIAAAFERAGIDAFFLEGVPRLDPAARSLSLLLDLVGADLERARVMEFLTSARVRWAAILGDDADVSPSGWDRISARAGVVSGLAAWRARLAEARQAREEREYDDDHDLPRYDSLLRLIERLAADLAPFPEKASWAAYLEATLALLDGWIERAELVHERLERVLSPLARYAPDPTREAFVARVREVFATQVYREGSFGEGRVFVGGIASARGLRFRRVYVPGLVERAFPGLVRPDPLLLDDEREALSPDLRTTRDGQERERLLFVDAVRAAEERLVLSYPRFDTGSGRERVPSSFLLRALEAALGRRVGAADLARLATPGGTALGRPHPEDPAVAIDRIERDLALVTSGQPGAAAHLAEPGGFLVRSLAQERASWDASLTAWDGVVDVGVHPERAAALRVAGQPSSASAVQTFAECPYRHFLRRGLRLWPWEEPERAYQVDSKDVGSIYHVVAHRLFAELAENGGLPLRETALEGLYVRVGDLLEEELTSFAEKGGIVNPALLDPVRVRLRSDLEEMLRDEIAAAADGEGFVPVAFEREFADLDVPVDGGGPVRFRGKIDRIDATAGARRVRVIDYKTGGHYWKKEEQWKGGRELQLAIYNRAAQALYPDSEVEEAAYYYATAKGEYRRKGCPATPEVAQTLEKVLATLDGLAQAGVFPPVADSCRFCDFTTICGPFREARAERKKGDGRLAEFRRLRDLP
jgi:RecB family exonuclease